MHTRPIRFDPHVHTAASYDSTAPVDAVLERASEACLDAVAVTNHDTMAGAWAAVDRNVDGVTVVPSVEVSTADGHLLALGVGSCPDSGQSFVHTVEAVRAQGGIAIVPHPFQRSRHGVGQGALTDCDGIEAYNARLRTADKLAVNRSIL
jgi:predicted metal-dependent phosphoesterase TrpH